MMTEEQIRAEAEASMQEVVEPTNVLKSLFVGYVGTKLQPENNEVTIDMCVRVLAEEFPEFLIPVVEQNYLLGYRQCALDLEQYSTEQEERQLTELDVLDNVKEESDG